MASKSRPLIATTTETGIEGDKTAEFTAASETVVTAFESVDASLVDIVDEAEQHIRACQEPARRAALHLGVGLICEDRLADPYRAVRHFQDAFRCAEDGYPLLAARRVFARRANWTMVVTLLDAELARTEGVRRAGLLLLRGQLMERWFADEQEAISCYERALEADSCDWPARIRLRRLYRLSGRNDQLFALCQTAATACSDRTYRALLYAEVAGMYEQRGEIDTAIEWYASSLVDNPANAAVTLSLKALYQRRRRWGDLVETLLAEGELSQLASERIGAYLVASRICRYRLEQDDWALSLLSRVREFPELGPRAAAVVAEIADLLRAAGRYEELSALCSDNVDVLKELGPVATPVWRDLGNICASQLGQVDRAVEHFERALALDPLCPVSLGGLERAYREQNDWHALISLWQGEAERSADDCVAATQLVRAAGVAEMHLDDLRLANDLLRSAASRLPDDLAIRSALRQLALRREDWPALVELLKADLSGAKTKAAAAGLALRIAELLEHRLGDRDAAAAFYQRALEFDTVHLREVLLSNVQRVGDLRGQLQLLDQQAEASEDVEQWAMLQLYAAQLLEWSLDQAGTAIERCFSVLERQPGNERARVLAQRIARYSGDWPSWLRLAEAMAAEDTQSLMRRAAVYEQHDPKSERALELYRRAHEQGDVSALWALASALRRRKQWQPWAELIERNIDVWRRSEEERIEALCLVAQLYELQPERRDRALRCYQRAFDLDQRNWYAREGLTRLLLENDQWVEAAAVLRQAVAAIESAGPRLLKGVAALNERVGLIDEAIEQYNSVRLRQEADVEANDALCRLVGRHQELEFDLERVWGELAELCQDPALEAALRLEQAVLRDAHSSLERDAEPLYRLLVRQPQTATVAAAALERSYGQRRDYARMAQLLEQPLHVAERPAERAHRLFRFAGCCWELGQLQPAADALVEVLDFREDFVTIRLLRHVSEGLGAWENVARLLEREAVAGADRSLRQRALLESARLRYGHLHQPEQAIELLMRALELDPSSEQAFSEIHQLLSRDQRWEELVDVALKRVQLCDPRQLGAERIAQWYYQVADLLHDKLDRPGEALSSLERALDLNPDYLPALRLAGELCVRQRQWSAAVDIYTHLVEVSHDTVVIEQSYRRLAEIWSEHVIDRKQAIACLQGLLMLSPTDIDALQRLYQLFLTEERWESAAETVSRLIENERDATRLARHHIVLARLYESQLQEPERALQHLSLAQQALPNDESTLAMLAGPAERLGAWQLLAQAIGNYLETAPSDRQNNAWRLRLARIAAEQLGDAERALSIFCEIRDSDPQNVESRIEAGALLVKSSRLADALVEYASALQIAPCDSRVLAALFQLWREAGDDLRAFSAASALVMLSAAGSEQSRYFAERKDRFVHPPSTSIDRARYEALLVHPGEPAQGRALLSALADAAHRIRPVRLEELGLRRGDRLGPRAEHPVRQILRDVRDLMDIKREVDLYVSTRDTQDNGILCTDPPALVLRQQTLEALPPAAVKALIGYLLRFVKDRCWIAWGLDALSLERLVRAVECIFDHSGRVDQDLSDPAVVEMARSVQRGVGRRGRRDLESAVEQFDGVRLDFAAWSVSMHYTAARCALWLTDEMQAVGAALSHVPSPPASLVEELVRFSFGDAFVAVRQVAGRG